MSHRKNNRSTAKDHKPKNTSKTRKGKQKLHSINYEDFQSGKDNEDDKHSKTSAKNSKPTSGPKNNSKEVKPQTPLDKSTSDVDVNAVPDPVPDTGLSVTSTTPKTSTPVIHTGVLPVIPSTTLSASSTPGFSPLPPLASFATTISTTSLAYSTSSPFATPSTTLNPVLDSSSTHPKRLSTLAIVLFSVGFGLLLFGSCILLWVCTRPRKRTHPTPSLPILQEDFPSESKVDADEESLFGGKERTSPRPGSNGVLWTWTQYPHSSMTAAKTATAPATIDTQRIAYQKRVSTNIDEKTAYPFTGHGVIAPEPTPPHQPPLQQQFQTALTRAANRVSAMSAFIYPTSPQTNGYNNIGFAVSGSPLTADGLPVLRRNNSKAASSRRQSKAIKARQSVANFDMLTVPNVAMEDQSTDAYGGADIGSPYIPTPATPKVVLTASNSVGGRARVKGPYAPVTALRTSTSVSALPTFSRLSVGAGHANPFETFQYVLPPISPVMKSEARRERDTKALTSALGLASPPPPPPSPQPTLFPDDSITLAGDPRRSRAFGHGRMQSQVVSPTMEASARLGNLMLAEFQSMASLPSTRNDNLSPPSSTSRSKTASRKRTEDKPPRVPSPPPMPSLAQMALAHTNPEDYADYRSPTYSIYGLYETDRKSRVSGGGY